MGCYYGVTILAKMHETESLWGAVHCMSNSHSAGCSHDAKQASMDRAWRTPQSTERHNTNGNNEDLGVLMSLIVSAALSSLASSKTAMEVITTVVFRSRDCILLI